MRRYHLFEFLDQSWLPDPLRLAATRYLNAAYSTTPFPAYWAGVLARVLDECGIDRIVDIGSGSGGPMQLVLKEMAKLGPLPHVTLTDLHPAPAGSSLDYWPEPVCATSVPLELRGVRTLFTCFHHFNSPTAQAVLRDAFVQRQPICIFEATSRIAPAIAASFAIPFLVLFLTPRVRPFSASQFALTYLIPVMPLLALWDGFVSQLRTYSIAELQALTRDCNAPDYVWKCGLIKGSRVPFSTSYLLGLPR